MRVLAGGLVGHAGSIRMDWGQMCDGGVGLLERETDSDDVVIVKAVLQAAS